MAFPLRYMRVTGNIAAIVPDFQGLNGSGVPDGVPDSIPLSGDVEFSMNLDDGDYVLCPADPAGPSIKVVAPTMCKLDVDGNITYGGRKYVELFTPDEHTYPKSAKYTVRFLNLKRGMESVNIRPFSFEAIPGADIDLASVARVPGTQSSPVTVGPAGAGLQAVRLDGDDLIFTVSNGIGDLPAISLPGIGDLDGYVAATEAAADEALESRNDAAAFVITAGQRATAAGQSADAAAASAASMTGSVTAAQAARDAAQGFRDTASGHVTSAANARDAAMAARDVALQYRDTAKTHRDDTVALATQVQGQTAAIGNVATAVNSARDTTLGYRDTASTKAGDAAASAVTAKNEADRAATYVGGVADGAIINSKVAANAAIDQSKINGLVAALNGKAPSVHDHAGQTISPSLTGYRVGAYGNNTVFDAGQDLQLASVPFGMEWSDLFSFNNRATPIFSTSTDGTTFTTEALTGGIFANLRGATGSEIDGTSKKAMRFQWDSGLSWGTGGYGYLLLNVPYIGPTVPNTAAVIESSADGATWTVRHTSTFSKQQTILYLPIVGWGGDARMRVTFSVSNAVKLRISNMKMLVPRPDMGMENFGAPVTWDSAKRLGVAGAPAQPLSALQIGTNTADSTGGITFGTDTTLYRDGASSLRVGGTLTASSVRSSLAPTDVTHLTRKDYVDAQIATRAAATALASKADLDGNGKVPQSQMPAVALTDFLGVVANQAAMLALSGQRGDWCNRSDTGTEWQLIAEPSTTLASWQEKIYPASPVQSVAGRSGAVTLSKADVGLGSVDNTADSAKPVSTAQQTALNAKVTNLSGITGIQKITSAAYAALATKDASTLYVVAG